MLYWKSSTYFVVRNNKNKIPLFLIEHVTGLAVVTLEIKAMTVC